MAVEVEVQGRLAEGDLRGAATLAIQAYGPKVLGYLRSILRDDNDAADAFSSFAEDLWRGIGGYRGEASFKTWAYKLAWCAAMHVRSDAYRRLGRRLESGEASALAADIRTRSAVRDEVQRRGLDRLRATLTPEEQTLLFLRLDLQLGWSEVAEVLSATGTEVDAAAVRKRFERLKTELARLVREQGLLE
jgi:RNA polymerase sigma-70 factor (ECF subfamily)